MRALILSVLCLVSAGFAVAEKPNIVVFLVDDMGVMDTSVPMLADEKGEPKRYPLNDWYRTPGMERLAAQGIRFSQFYAQSVCSPTRVSIMTGQNAARHRTTNWIKPEHDNAGTHGPSDWNWRGLKKGDVTLPAVLRDAGYRTMHVGKAHFGPTGSEGAEPLNLGFDINVGGASFGLPGSYYGEKNYGTDVRDGIRAVPHLEKYHGSETFLTEALTREAKVLIADAVEARQPFFLHLSHYAVHSPFESDPRFAAAYEGASKSPHARAFATLIAGMDQSLNDILDSLEALGVAENTLVVFLGDNGTDGPLGHHHAVSCAAPLRGKKGAHYEGGMRVPFIAAWAKPDPDNPFQKRLPIAAGELQTQVGTIMDIYPTLLELAGADNPEGHVTDGISLKTLFAANNDDSREEMFLMHYPHGLHRSSYFTSFRLNDWKLVYHYNPQTPDAPRYELFNLAEDPFEQTDVSSGETVRLAEMVRAMVARLDSQGALYPVSKSGEVLKPVVPDGVDAK